MRPWAEPVYGLPPERVIGSSIVTEFQMRDGKPVLVRLPRVDFIDDKAGKPVAIQKFIGRRPIAAFGNSDGDFQMLQWATSGAAAGSASSSVMTMPSASTATTATAMWAGSTSAGCRGPGGLAGCLHAA